MQNTDGAVPTLGGFDFVATDKLGPLLKTETGNRFTVMITERYAK